MKLLISSKGSKCVENMSGCVIVCQMANFFDYIRLTRLNRPVGVLLLLWPTLWALWIAAEGVPNSKILFIFIVGTILMRSAGCVINDFADREFDKHVERTKDRPLTSGRILPHYAIILCLILSLIALILVMMTNELTIFLAIIGVVLMTAYPFMKRFTDFPQVVLGAAFAMAIPMSFSAQLNTIPAYSWLLYVAVLLWTVAYDTEYAMVDREDDLKIGIRSTAIRFGEYDRLMIGFLHVIMLIILLSLGMHLNLSIWFYMGIIIAVGLFGYQQYLIQDRYREKCFQAFLNNQWVGGFIFLGIFLHYYLQPGI